MKRKLTEEQRLKKNEYQNKWRRNWKIKNPERVNEKDKQSSRLFKLRHPELVKKYNKSWRLNNKEKKRKDNINWKIKNPNWLNEYYKNRRKIDIQFNICAKLRTLLWITLNNYTNQSKIMSSKQYGINWFEVVKYLIQILPKDYEEWNKNNPDNPYSIDHIIPLSSFDLEDKEEIKKAFAPENHQWLKLKDNCSKGKKLNYIYNN